MFGQDLLLYHRLPGTVSKNGFLIRYLYMCAGTKPGNLTCTKTLSITVAGQDISANLQLNYSMLISEP